MKIECVILEISSDKDSEWMSSFFLHHRCSTSPSHPLCLLCLHKDERLRRRRSERRRRENREANFITLYEEHLSLSGISFHFSCSSFFCCCCACSHSHRIYIMMEILNLLIYFISYFTFFSYMRFHISFSILISFSLFLELVRAIIRRFIFLPKVIHHNFSINIMRIYCYASSIVRR